MRTLYGHSNSCNRVEATLTVSSLPVCVCVRKVWCVQGDQVYSCDCFGALVQWDLRAKTAHANTWELGPYSINSLAVDPAGRFI